MDITLEWDADALAAPQSFRTSLQQAASELDAVITNPITVNISVGYGEFGLGTSGYQPLTSNYSLGGIENAVPISYSALRSALASADTSSAESAAVNTLPNTAALDGQSQFFVASAQAKALGALPASDPSIDGYIGFPSSFSGSFLIDAGMVEMLHAMGMLNAGGALGLFSFSSPGVNFLPSGATSTTPAYFSLNDGKTDLANYDVGFDETLFENLSSDPLSIGSGATTLTALDLEEINAIGFTTGGTVTTGFPAAIPVSTASGASPVVTTRNISVGENASVAATSMVASVAVPSGALLAGYGFYANGSGGYFTLNGVAQPDNQWVNVLSTQLGQLQYVGGSAAGSQTVYVAALTYGTDASMPGAALTATTTVAGSVPAGSSGTATGASTTSSTSTTATGTSSTGSGNASSTSSSAPPLNPAAVADSAAQVYIFANVGAPSFTSVVSADGSADLSHGVSAVTPGFIGGYVAGLEIRAIGNLEQTGGSTAQMDGQLGSNLVSLSAVLSPGGSDAGFGFLAGLASGGPASTVSSALPSDLVSALGSNAQAVSALAGCINGSVAFVQGFINNVNAGQSPIAALHAVENPALV